MCISELQLLHKLYSLVLDKIRPSWNHSSVEEDQRRGISHLLCPSKGSTANIKSNTQDLGSVFSVCAKTVPTTYACVHCNSEVIMCEV